MIRLYMNLVLWGQRVLEPEEGKIAVPLFLREDVRAALVAAGHTQYAVVEEPPAEEPPAEEPPAEEPPAEEPPAEEPPAEEPPTEEPPTEEPPAEEE